MKIHSPHSPQKGIAFYNGSVAADGENSPSRAKALHVFVKDCTELSTGGMKRTAPTRRKKKAWQSELALWPLTAKTHPRGQKLCRPCEKLHQANAPWLTFDPLALHNLGNPS